MSRFNKRVKRKLLAIVFLAFLSVNIYWFGQLIQPVSAASAPAYKWTRPLGTAGRTYLQALAADVNHDGNLEIVVVGGSEDYGNDGSVSVLNGATGAIIWQRKPYSSGSDPGIGAHTPFEIADLDLDGTPEIIVAARRGVLVYRGNGDVYWRNPSALAEENYVAVGDVNGDGYPEVFVCQGYVPTGRTDYITELSYDGRILRQAWNWHPCWGGLTIGDTNHDGKLELYQGDRSVVYSGSDDLYFGGGMGVRALDAETLTPLWDDPTILCSSHAPILADVDKDGTEEVIVADQSASGIAVLNSADGTVNGGIRKGGTSMPAHSAPTVYDIDGDGNLEFISNRESQPKIFDLYSWQLEATLPLTCNEPPKLGNVTGNSDGLLDIIASTGYDQVVGIYHYDTNTHTYLNPWNLSRSDLLNANAFSLVADVDGDGSNELVFTTGNAQGNVVCFNTNAQAPNPRVRSDVMFYGENRAGAAVYVPSLTPTVPVLSNEVPVNTSVNQGLNPTLSIRAVDYQGNMDITFRTNASGTWQVIGSYTNVINGTYNANATGANSINGYGTKYYWNVTATHGGSRASNLYSFTTLSQPPSGSSALVSSGGTNGTKDNLICSNQSTTDPNNDKVSNIYDWSVNGNSLTDLNLPFDTRTSSNPFVGETMFRDGFESGLTNWNMYSSLTWSRTNATKHSGIYSATTTSATSTGLISNDLDTSNAESITVSFWFRKHGITDSNMICLRFYNGTSYKYILNVETPLNFLRRAPDDTWLYFSIQTYDPQFLFANFRMRIDCSGIPSGGQLWIDDVSITTTTKTKDYSVNDNDATVHAATWTSDGVVGGAYVFDGKTSYLKLADDPTLGGNGTRSEISLEFWVKPLTSQLGARIMMKHDPTETDASYMTGFNSAGTANTLFWGVITSYDNAYHEVYSSNTVLAAGNWYHVVCTYKSGTGLAIYINGTLRASSPVLGNIVAIGDSIFGQPLYIGYDGGTARSASRFFNGVLDEVRIYERALAPMQVSQRYNETRGGVSSSETVTWQETNLGDVWRCRVTPNDGFGDGNTVQSNALTVSVVSPNTLPVASGLALSPIPVYGTGSLTGQYTYSDANGDPEWGTEIRWYKNGVLQPLLNDSLTVPVGLMSKNQVWNFTVRPNDGAGFGALQWVAVTVSNSPPTFTGVYISPDPAMSTDTLKAIGVGWFDADNDTAGYLYQWQKRQTDGSWLNIAGQTSQTLGPAYFKSNDTVRVNCTAFDGQNTGTSLMETKWIANFSLPLANPLLVSSLGTNTTAEDLICYNVTGTQLTNIYNWNLNGSPWASLLMPFDTNSAGTAKDYSGNGNTGTVSGAAWTNQGVVGGAYAFSTDGETSGDVITVQDSATLGGDGTWTQLSIEFWIKESSSQSGTRVLAKKIGNQPAGAYGSYTVEFRSGNALRFGVTTSPTSDPNATGTSYRIGSTATTTLNVGDWYHVVCTYKSGVGLAIYLNGTLRVTGSATGYIHPIGIEPLFIGFDGGTDYTRYFNGTLDELRIYPNAITAAQVLQRFMETADKSVKTETIVSEQLQAGQQWSCQVTPNTGSADGTAKFSNTVTIVAAPVVTQWKLTVEVSGSGITNATGTAMYNSGTVVHVLATPSAGWSLNKWLLNGSGSGSANPYTITMTANYNLTAVFIPVPENMVPLSGWVVDSSLTNAPYTLNSTESSLSLELAAVNTNSRVTVYSLGVPSSDLGGFDHIDVAVTGTSNAKILLRFFMDNGAGFDVVYWSNPTTLDAISFDLSPYAGRKLTVVYVALMSSDGLAASINITGITLVTEAPPPVVPLSGWTVDPSLTNAAYTLNSTGTSLSLGLTAVNTSSRVTIYTLGVPTLNLGDYDHIDVAVTGTANARILLRFFMDNGAGFDVVYWADPATLNAISFDLTAYSGRTLTIAYIALMSSNGLTASVDITDIAFVATAPPPMVPLSGWTVDPSLTNAAYTLNSTESSLSLGLTAVNTSSRVTIYTLGVPTSDLGGFDHIDVSVAGTSNARILLRFFLDDGTGFDVVYWADPATLDAVSFDLSAYTGRTLSVAYIALMSSDGLDVDINITEIALVVEAPPPVVPLAGWVMDSSLTNAVYTLNSSESSLSLALDSVDTSSRVTIYALGVPMSDLGDFDHIDVSITGTSNARILLRFFMDDGSGFDVVYWADPATLDTANFDLSAYAGRTLTVSYIALMSSDGLDASIDITQIALVATAPLPVVPLAGWTVDSSLTNAPFTLDSSPSLLSLDLAASETSGRVTIYTLGVPALDLTNCDHIDVSVTGTANARILLRFFLDDGTGFDVVYWADPATLNAISFDLTAYAGRTLTIAYIALMSSDGLDASVDIAEITFVASAPAPVVPLSGWVVDTSLTNSLYTLNSTDSLLSLVLDAVDTASRVTIYSVAVPSLDLGSFDHIDVAVTGTSNARVLLRFFLDDGTGFDVVYWADPTTLDAINFDLSAYAGRTLTIAYVALMSSDGSTASIDITQIVFIAPGN